jgi:hypothetical protein
MPFRNNSVNLGPSVVNAPLVNQGVTLANAEITANTTSTAVEVGDDYFTGYLVVSIPYMTLTSVDIQVYTSDVDSSITTTGTLIYDSGVVAAAGQFFIPLADLVPSVVPGSGPQPEPVINQWLQVKATVVGSGLVAYSVMLLI